MEDETAISRTIIKADAKRQKTSVVSTTGAFFMLIIINAQACLVAERARLLQKICGHGERTNRRDPG